VLLNSRLAFWKNKPGRFTQSKKKDEGHEVRLAREANTAMLGKLVWIQMIHAKYFANIMH
jgi:hypothetical protein